MLTDQSHVVGGQGYCDPNREDQGYSFVPASSMSTVIGKVIPRPDEEGSFKIDHGLLFDDSSINNTIQLSKSIDPIGFAAHIKENTLMIPTEQPTQQLRGESPVLIQYDELPYYKTGEQIANVTDVTRDPVSGTLTVNHDGHYTGLGLGTEGSTFGEKLDASIGTIGVTGAKGALGPRGVERPAGYNPDGSLAKPGNDHRTEGERLEDAVRQQAFQTFEGNRAQRRRARAAKQKAAPKHVTNTQTKHVKAALGSVILGKLGQIQLDTTDSIKREVLKTMPLSRFAEVVGGKEIPEYQKRLLDLQQARAEGSLKPELSSLRDQSAKAVADSLRPTVEDTSIEAPVQ